VVRVQAGRLRTKLQEYYTAEGKNDQIIIDLPKGHYHPVFSCPQVESPKEIPASRALTENTNGHPALTAAETQRQAENVTGRSRARAVTIVLGALVALLIVAVAALYSSNRTLRSQARTLDPSINTEDFKAVWGPFVDDAESPLLVLSNPTVYRFLNDADPGSLQRRALQLTPEQTRWVKPSASIDSQTCCARRIKLYF
jgi:hypothetical protein